MKRDLRRLLEDARRRGWRIERTRSSHYRLRHPSGALVFTGSTPSCHRALMNLRADLRRVEQQGARVMDAAVTGRKVDDLTISRIRTKPFNVPAR